MANKKRRRDSFQAEQGGEDDARKRLEAFHARMFELPQEEAAVAARETPRVTFKAKKKHKKHKALGGDEEDGEPVPMVKFNAKPKKEKKTKKPAVAVLVKKDKKVAGPAVVKVPGMPTVVKNEAFKTKIVTQVVKVEKKKVQNSTVQTAKKTEKVQVAVQAPQWHSMKNGDAQDDDSVDPLEQALGSMKEMATKHVAKSPHKKHKSVIGEAVAAQKMEKPKIAELAKPKMVESAEASQKADAERDVGNQPACTASRRQKKNKRKKLNKLKQAALQTNDSNTAPGTPTTLLGKANTVSSADNGELAVSKSTATVTGSAASQPVAASPKSPRTRKKQKKSSKVNGMNSASPNTIVHAQPRQGKPLVLSDDPESEVYSKLLATYFVACSNANVVEVTDTVVSKKVKTVPTQKGKTSTKVATASVKKSIAKEKEATKSTKPLTPIAASLAKDSKKKTDMFLSAREASVETSVAPKRVVKAVAPPVVSLMESSDSEEDSGVDSDPNDGSSLFSRLIDSAAREQWELLEVGRLVRLFAAEWGFKEGKTARFLLDTCPELVSVDFLEGLGINLSAKHLMQVFEAGSGKPGVLMNKMASALENGHLSVRDPSFISALERKVSLMESNAEVMELLHPLMESMSTVRDVGYLLKQLCEHWQLERKISLVQQVLLSNIFDDLDGNQDEILLDLPDLTDRLDFPSRLDQEDVDENGNLKGFLANDDSEFSGEEGSEEELDGDDSEDDEEDPYEGETDSENEAEITGRPRGRNQFIEDEADVGEEDEEEEEEEEERHDDDELSSSSDSD
ncbi:hypothetical protein PR001_g9421 [Phytophthora rubi]|uniref:Uncharacterized protein n=1 Tax=Phytophthora rubi TaxID=129364 RepID=A0A6A3N1G3_9STRA|nr:hypothetical protein PR002_g7797 [Phytophthora rubi]KAE9035174.1 hypothetical protein PR001_g9421 [Phytophthora rubi]